MIKLRYSIWRRSIPLGAAFIALCFAGMATFGEGVWGSVLWILLVTAVVVNIAFQIVVSLFEKAGLLEFTYTEADRSSSLYNMEKLQRQMTENRRARKREQE
jgi:hypothetical protein